MQLSVSDACVYFYPRSPCGERPVLWRLTMILGKFLSTLSLRRATLYGLCLPPVGKTFLSTLSLRRATSKNAAIGKPTLISIHALLAESDVGRGPHAPLVRQFLSTLSLRRATPEGAGKRQPAQISIHALLAESDTPRLSRVVPTPIFLSTLSLRRATKHTL